MNYSLTISNPNSNLFLWQDQDYKGDITIEVRETELNFMLDILMRNNCDVLIRATKEEE